MKFYLYENRLSHIKKLNDLALQVEEGGGGEGGEVTWATLTGKPAVIAAGADQAAARAAIGATNVSIGIGPNQAMAGNTALLQIGTTATTAKAGDWMPPDVTGSTKGLMLGSDKAKLDGIAAGANFLEIGTTATTAKAGNYQPTWAQVTGKPVGVAVANAASADDIVAQFNALLASLRTAGFIAA